MAYLLENVICIVFCLRVWIGVDEVNKINMSIYKKS